MESMEAETNKTNGNEIIRKEISTEECVVNEEKNETNNENNEEKKKDKLDASMITKYIALIRMLSNMKIMREDAKPVEIIDNLFIGSIGSASNLQNLKEAGITHIVNAARGIKRYFPDDFVYVNYDLLDSPDENIKKHFEESGAFIDEALKNNGKVFVHCHAGISRSSTIIIAYMIKYRKMTFDDALKLAKSKREKINPNSGFVKQLREYQEELASSS